MGTNPFNLEITSDGQYVYVVNSQFFNFSGGNTVSVIETKTNRVISTIKVGTDPFTIGITS
ncbi:hypothetical protein [Polycladospora coralii]|uniref:hypothetical protein n=1 Tax=Polycladospora coralii TaxID=2771432 RepID=UPI0032207970